MDCNVFTLSTRGTDHCNIYEMDVMTKPQSSINYLKMPWSSNVPKLFGQSSSKSKARGYAERTNWFKYRTHHYTKPTTSAILRCITRAHRTLTPGKSRNYATIRDYGRLKCLWINRRADLNFTLTFVKLYDCLVSRMTTVSFKFSEQPTSRAAAMSSKVFHQRMSLGTDIGV